MPVWRLGDARGVSGAWPQEGASRARLGARAKGREGGYCLYRMFDRSIDR